MSVWFGNGENVSLPSYRVSFVPFVYGMFVNFVRDVSDSLVSKYRPEPKNHSMSFRIGPPSVASYVGTTEFVNVPSCGFTPVAVR